MRTTLSQFQDPLDVYFKKRTAYKRPTVRNQFVRNVSKMLRTFDDQQHANTRAMRSAAAKHRRRNETVPVLKSKHLIVTHGSLPVLKKKPHASKSVKRALDNGVSQRRRIGDLVSAKVASKQAAHGFDMPLNKPHKSSRIADAKVLAEITQILKKQPEAKTVSSNVRKPREIDLLAEDAELERDIPSDESVLDTEPLEQTDAVEE